MTILLSRSTTTWATCAAPRRRRTRSCTASGLIVCSPSAAHRRRARSRTGTPGDNEVGVVTCWPTFQRSAREGSSQRSLLWGWQTTFSMFASASGRGWERGAPPRGGERRAPGAADLVRAASPHSHCPQHQRSRAGRTSRSARARGLRGAARAAMGPRTARTQPAFGHQATGELRPGRLRRRTGHGRTPTMRPHSISITLQSGRSLIFLNGRLVLGGSP